MSILNTQGENGKHSLLPDFSRIAFMFSPFSLMMTIGLLHIAMICLGFYPLSLNSLTPLTWRSFGLYQSFLQYLMWQAKTIWDSHLYQQERVSSKAQEIAHALTSHKDPWWTMFITTLIIAARNWKQPRYPLLKEWMKDKWYIYTMECYWAV